MNEPLHFLAQHGSVVLFSAVLAEQMGLPIPAFPFLIAAGALVASGQMAWGAAIGLAVIASLLGDQVWYELGKHRGRRVLTWLCQISLEPTSCVRRTEELFARHGVRSLVVAKFIPGLSTIAPPLAAIAGLSLPQYLLYNGAGTILWVGAGIGLGYIFIDQLEQVVSFIARLGPAVALLMAAGIGGYVLYKVLHRFRLGRTVPRLSVQEVRERIALGEAPLFIDLRPSAARQETPGIPGSLWMSVEQILVAQDNLPQDRDL